MIDLPLGTRVVARDALNKLRTGTVDRVPAEWRDRSHSVTFTTRGAFPKIWVRFVETDNVVPWPAEDVFVDIDRANAAVANHEAMEPTWTTKNPRNPRRSA